ncbi:MAG: hypothetical protein ACJAS1_004655 [Oleiphilaceae bacterium]
MGAYSEDEDKVNHSLIPQTGCVFDARQIHFEEDKQDHYNRELIKKRASSPEIELDTNDQ